MTNQEKAELYRKVIDLWKDTYVRETGLSDVIGLCTFFNRIIIGFNKYYFLKDDLKATHPEMSGLYVFWPACEYEPRLQYLENRLSHYQTLVENERT